MNQHTPELAGYREQIVVDVTGWREQHRSQLAKAISAIQADVDGKPAFDPSRSALGWTRPAITTMLERMTRGTGAVQARAFEIALANGGTIDREAVYELGGYPPTRKLNGWTRPVNGIVKKMRASGEVPTDAANPFFPVYDGNIKGYQQAKGFSIPPEIVDLLTD